VRPKFFDGKYLAKRRALILTSRFLGQEGFLKEIEFFLLLGLTSNALTSPHHHHHHTAHHNFERFTRFSRTSSTLWGFATFCKNYKKKHSHAHKFNIYELKKSSNASHLGVSQKFASFRRNSVIWPIYIDSHLN
jgi:hypothetical protein